LSRTNYDATASISAFESYKSNCLDINSRFPALGKVITLEYGDFFA
jgi:hypothetical protein